MSKVKEVTPETNLCDPQYYFNRELSWIEFNRRVLHEALDARTPLLEQLKFVAIFSSNLDEFFMVRVSGLKDQVEAQVGELTPDGRTPQQQLDEIAGHLRPLVAQQHQLFEQELRPRLAAVGVRILNYTDISDEQRLKVQRYFEASIFPVLTPLAVDPAHPFPYISNLSLNLAVVVKDPETGAEHFARVKVPNSLPRFVQLPHDGQPDIWVGVPLEQAIAHNLESLFPGMNIQERSFFRVTRDADFGLEQDEGEDLMLAIEQELRQRRVSGSVMRMEIQASTPPLIRKTLEREMKLTEIDIYEIEGLLGLKDLMSFMALPLPKLKDSPFMGAIPKRLRWMHEPEKNVSALDVEEAKDIFAVIRQQDLLVHHPYDSFTASVEQFITQAAHDPGVLAIKMTLYRTSGDSPIVKALIAAGENGKQVAVLVELKARFDEENNVSWARELESSGVHVVYGMLGLKTHTKVVLVVRQEESIRRYVHIGTGNYNSKTAKLYTDLGVLSCRDELGADLTDLFNYLTGFSKQKSYRKLLVAPVTLRDRMMALIRREIEHCKNGNPGRLVAKINSLVDTPIITLLYEASGAGVQIDLIVRGMCCLRPGIQGVSENIRVISIIGRYLEHSRIFHFHNNAQDEVYIGSADWMARNLDGRVEAVTPIEDPDLAKELKEILEIFLTDNRQAWELHPDGSYKQRHPTDGSPEKSAQNIFMERAK